MGPEEQELEAFRQDEAHLGPIREARVRHRLAELTSHRGGALGHTPFQDVLPRSEATSPSPDGEIRPLAEVGARGPARDAGRQGRARLLAVAAAVVLVLVGAVVVVSTAGDGPRDDVVAGLGDGSLASLAERAGQRPDRPLAEGEYLYQRIDEGVALTLDGRAGTEQRLIERWVAADGTGRERAGERRFTELATGSVEIREDETDVLYEDRGALRFDRLTYEQLRGLPTEIPELLRALGEVSPGDSADPTWRIQALAELLMLEPVAPSVRAAAFDGLDELGLTSIGSVSGAEDRVGEGFAFTGGGSTVLVIIDPVSFLATSVRVARSEVAGLDPVSAAPNTWRTVLEDRITTSLS